VVEEHRHEFGLDGWRQFLNGISSLFFFDRRVRRGPSDFTWARISCLLMTGISRSTGSFGASCVAVERLGMGRYFNAKERSFTPLLDGDFLGLNNTDPFDFPARLNGPGCNSAVNPGTLILYQARMFCFSEHSQPTR